MKLLKALLTIAAFNIFLYVIIFFLTDSSSTYEGEYDDLYIDYYAEEDVVHDRCWEDYFENENCVSYNVDAANFIENKNLRNEIQYPFYDGDYTGYWNIVYKEMEAQNTAFLDTILDSLKTIIAIKNLDRIASANLIVSFIQDIPYSYILDEESCSDGEHSDHPCLDGIKYGVLSPVEFLYTLRGDCDTRTLLLYCLFKKLGYDPLIMISINYLHAMLALDINVQGDYKMHNNKKYYFWETTATGWEAGMLPPSTNIIDYWEVALD